MKIQFVTIDRNGAFVSAYETLNLEIDVGTGSAGTRSASGTREEGRASGGSKKKQYVLVAKFKGGMKRGSATKSSPS